METTVTEQDNSRVKIDAIVPADEVKAAIEEAARHMSGDVKVAGFREGKVPPEMVLQKLGRDAVFAHAVQDSLAGWYEQALIETEISPVGDPKIDLPDLPEDGQPLAFSINVGVRPPAELGDWKGVEASRPEVEVPKDAVDEELERLREGFARLNPVDRPGKEGDVLLIDFTGTIDGEEFEGGQARDYLLEIGRNQVLPEFETALAGASAGDEKTAEVKFPDDYPAEPMQGKDAKFDISVKEVREKDLPALDDDFAAEASEFDTLEELRSHVEGRIKEILEARADESFREAALDAVAKQAKMDLPDSLVADRAAETWARVERQLEQRGMDPAQFLQMQGKTREQMIEEAKKDADLSLRREGVLDAVIEAEGIETSDEELREAVAPVAEREGIEVDTLIDRLAENGRDKLLRKDLQMRRALELIAESATPISEDKAEAREAIWTPEKERSDKEIWTPGSD